jgi:VanZ family protein
LNRLAARSWQVAFGVAVALNLAALYSPGSPGPGIPYLDKVTHLLLFAAVAFTGRRIGLPSGWLAGVLVLNAAVSELVQYAWLPHRSGDVFDALADLAGVALGVWTGGRNTAGRT